MKKHPRKPYLLVTPDTEQRGSEVTDLVSSLSEAYQDALLRAGGVPFTMPATIDGDIISRCVRHCDGVLLTGGDDLAPELYGPPLTPGLRQKVKVTPDSGRRDFREIQLIDQAFRQRKPLLAICRGHQVLNVALGGTLLADIATEKPAALPHRRMERKRDIVHEVRLTPGSLLHRIVGAEKLGVNSTHHQAVKRIAPPLRPVALSPDGIVEALELKPGAARGLPFLLSVQFHPERLVDRYAEHLAIFKAFVAACS